MQKFIEQLRQQPIAKRNRFVWICVTIVVIFMLAIWIIVGNHTKPAGKINLFQTLKKGIGDAKNNFSNPPQ